MSDPKGISLARWTVFFSNHGTVKDGELKFERGKKFKELIKERGSGQPGQHANREFRAALHWFCECGAIDKEEMEFFERAYILRNEIGHRLLEILSAEGKEPITVGEVVYCFGLYVKIVRWWVKEVEAATDPDMNQEKYDEIIWDKVESIDTVILREILQKALSNNPDWQMIKEIIENFPETKI